MNDVLLSVIVPSYKQENSIYQDVKNIHDALSETSWPFEIITVIDGFVDKSMDRAKPLEQEHPNIIVRGYPTNKGKGYAVRYGMARSKGTHIAFIDGGMDIHPKGLPMILEHLRWYDADIIVGSKKHPASKVNYPLLRKIYSFGYHLIVRILFGLKVKDTQTGLKIYRRQVLEKVMPRLIVKQFAFDIEILAVAYRLGFRRIYEAPVEIIWDFKNTGFKKFMFFDPYIRNMLIDTLAIFYRVHILRYYDDDNERKWVYDEELKMKVNTS